MKFNSHSFHRRVVRLRELVATATAFVLLAGPDPLHGQVTRVRDSVGIRIVENPSGEGLAPFRLAAQPTLEIGAAGQTQGKPLSDLILPAALFQLQPDVMQRLSGGTIVVANRRTAEILFFDQSGRLVRTLDGAGQGTASFASVLQIARLRGDSIAAWDSEASRVLVFDSAGNFGRSFVVGQSLTPTQVQRTLFSTILPGAMSDGSLFAYRRGAAMVVRSWLLQRDTLVVARFSPSGRFESIVAQFEGREMMRTGRADTSSGGVVARMSFQPLPFGRATTLRVANDYLYAGDGTTYEVWLLDRAGILKMIIRKDFAASAVTPGVIAKYKDAILTTTDVANRTMTAQMLADTPFPSALPAYSTFTVDAIGRLWVQDYQRPSDASARWNVFDAAGRLLGAVVVPRQFTLSDIGRDHAMGVWTMDDGSQHVRLYALVPATGR